MNSPFARVVLLISFGALFAGCGGDSGGIPFFLPQNQPQAPQGVTQGEVLAMVSDSTAPDSDGDYLPDDVEVYLGTNPDDPDTDHDGIPDFVEVFGYGTMNESAPVPDKDGDGVIAAADQDDNNDGTNDGQQVDSDGDGISNYLEYYGFTYNWMSGKYAPWNGTDYSKPYYKTDPHQKSTDQDPFDDNVEVTDVNMDVSVKAPGDLPMVPAYPDIYVRLEGYSVTLNQEITYTEGSSLAKGTTWERTAERNHSNTTEKNWEIGVSTTASFGSSFGGSVSYHANYGEKYGSTSGSSYSTASGGSILSEQNWSRAATSNPTDAARIKLYLKVYNKGTAVASGMIPTITLKIGGHNIATFEQGNAQINLLEPGGVYPAAPGVYWVVDSVDTGAGIAPLSLTLGELKALESGAPVSITLTQMAANVMLRNPQTGAYESVGDWNEYMARIRAVSANLFFDRGDGNFIRSYVYANDSLTSPKVTLGDALVWVAKGRQDPATGDIFITYYDEATKSPVETSIDGWQFAVDGETYKANEANGFTAGDDITTLRLNPRSVVVAKAPRSQVPGEGTPPDILAAYYDPTTESVTAVASDYNGIAKAEFVDKFGIAVQMKEDIPGSSFYVYAPSHDNTNYPNGYEFNGTEFVRVTNVNGDLTERSLIQVYTPPTPQPPVIVSVSADLQMHKLYTHVESDIPLDAAPAFVRAYGEMFKEANGYEDGYCEMERVSNWFEDPTGWVCDLYKDWTIFEHIDGTTVVALAGPDLYTSRKVTTADLYVHTIGSGVLKAKQVPGPNALVSEMLDFDTDGDLGFSYIIENTPPASDFPFKTASSCGNPPGSCGSFDIYLRPWAFTLNLGVVFGVNTQYLGIQGVNNVDFNALTRSDIKGMTFEKDPYYWWDMDGMGLFDQDAVFVYRTDTGRYGKILLHWKFRATLYAVTLYGNAWDAGYSEVDYNFVTFLAPTP